MSHRIASEGRLTYSEAVAKNKLHYLNLTKDLSWLNSRNHEHTDRDGHVVGYWCDVTIVLDSAADWLLGVIPNTWKMRNAFRKFHIYRDEMFKKAGVTKKEMGKYGRTIRPFFEKGMADITYPDPGLPQVPSVKENNVLIPVGCTDTQREWTYTELANEVAYSEGTIPGGLGDVAKVSDTWPLMVCGQNDAETTSGTNQTWDSVAMIHSYNLDRMEVVTPAAEEVIEGAPNPLAALRFQSAASGEVVDLAEEQELENPPYDIRDSGDSTGYIVARYANTNNATLQVVHMNNVFVPAGILAISQGSPDTVTPIVMVDVKGWSLCKDLA